MIKKLVLALNMILRPLRMRIIEEASGWALWCQLRISLEEHSTRWVMPLDGGKPFCWKRRRGTYRLTGPRQFHLPDDASEIERFMATQKRR